MVTAGAELELLVFELDWKTDMTEADNSSEPSAKKKIEPVDDIVGDMQNVVLICLSFIYIFQRYVSVKLRGKLLRQCKGRALQLALSPDERVLVCLVCNPNFLLYILYRALINSWIFIEYLMRRNLIKD